MFSLIASCKACGVEPWAYLRDVFTRLPVIPAERFDLLDALLLDRWLLAHPTHRWDIATQRRAERKQRQQTLRSRRKKLATTLYFTERLRIKHKQTKSGTSVYRYYRCAKYNQAEHPCVRIAEAEFDQQVLALFQRSGLKMKACAAGL